ncbi:PREDICTED: uncharacterized protein LOC109217444 [Nicotiana attenuata]|uniref:uncharacterized protein LOC109217444 n=1 Tax=Nicotiana attenuata TaxID=49451 RepID=UPI0009047AED|nr:PREDICTED: uncharacterized protein LOC109217444 [Nicotiana attenuata]
MSDGPSGAAEHKGYHYFTNDQYNQILNLLNKESHPESSIANMAGPGTSAGTGPGTSAGAAEVKCMMSNLTQKSQEKEWVVDSGATHHITSDLELLSDVKCTKKTDKDKVHLPTGEQADITHIGSAILLYKREIKDDLWNGKVKGIGKERGSFYVHRGLANRINALNALKSEAIVAIRQFICMVQNQFGIVIKAWHNSSKQLPLHSTTEWHSGERHRYILDTARALKFQGSIPTRYWGMCVKTAIYLINRLPSSILGGKTPYELLYHKNANISHLRTIGCLCYATNLVKTDKFAERAKAAILMGYSETQKGYMLLDLATKQFFTSRDVIFKESEFPFSKKDENRSHDSQEHMAQ